MGDGREEVGEDWEIIKFVYWEWPRRRRLGIMRCSFCHTNVILLCWITTSLENRYIKT